MSWFDQLVGFPEDPVLIADQLSVDGVHLCSSANGKRWRCGELETPSLAELRAATKAIPARSDDGLKVGEVVANVQGLHREAENDGALFQVASQFNLLEMVGPEVPPERGVGIYEYDATQGPACAIACGAATIYRNYFVPVAGGIGQTADRQVDCLVDVGRVLGDAQGSLWTMRNGYALATARGLATVGEFLEHGGEAARDRLRAALRIGVQWQSEVTLGGTANVVSQAFCSALPVAYSEHDAGSWEPFARLVLEAAYEATLHAALLNRERTGSSKVFLTLLGGGAFGNRTEWITAAMEFSLALFQESGLEVWIVSYGSRTPEIQHLIGR